MAERLTKIVQTWVNDETGETHEKVFEYDEHGTMISSSEDAPSDVAKAEAPEAPVEETADLEPEPPSGKLPDGFPGKAALDAADPPIHTYGQLAKFSDDYTKIPGIGAATAEKITEAVAHPEE